MQPVIDSDLEQIRQWPQDKASLTIKAYKKREGNGQAAQEAYMAFEALFKAADEDGD